VFKRKKKVERCVQKMTQKKGKGGETPPPPPQKKYSIHSTTKV